MIKHIMQQKSFLSHAGVIKSSNRQANTFNNGNIQCLSSTCKSFMPVHDYVNYNRVELWQKYRLPPVSIMPQVLVGQQPLLLFQHPANCHQQVCLRTLVFKFRIGIGRLLFCDDVINFDIIFVKNLLLDFCQLRCI